MLGNLAVQPVDRVWEGYRGGRKQNTSFGNPANLPVIATGRPRSFAPPGHPGLAFIARTGFEF